jgi:hypothetical protein
MAIAFVNDANLGYVSSASSFTVSYTCGSNANEMLFLLVEGDAINDYITGATYAGASMTLLGKADRPSTSRWMYCFYLLNPASGANNVVISASNTCDIILACISEYSGVGGLDTANTNTTSSSNFTFTVNTSIANDWAILGETNTSNASSSATSGMVQRSYDTNFQDYSIYDTNGVVFNNPGINNYNYTGAGAGVAGVIAAFYPAVASLSLMGSQQLLFM